MKVIEMDLRYAKLSNGLTLREDTLLRALKLQATTGMLLTNPRVTGYSSFAKAILACKVFNLDSKAPKTCKKLYQHLKEKGYYNE
jgi:hypothetical protein